LLDCDASNHDLLALRVNQAQTVVIVTVASALDITKFQSSKSQISIGVVSTVILNSST
jgi:hypothetical protein